MIVVVVVGMVFSKECSLLVIEAESLGVAFGLVEGVFFDLFGDFAAVVVEVVKSVVRLVWDCLNEFLGRISCGV